MTATAKPGQLKVQWGKAERSDEPSLIYLWGGDGAAKSDARVISDAIEGKRFSPTFSGGYEVQPSIVDELRARGYDLSTLKITISQLPALPSHPKPTERRHERARIEAMPVLRVR